MIHTTQHPKDIMVVRPGVNRLTAVNAKAFKDEVSELLDAGSTQIIVDFEDVSFLDSSGLGALVGILKRIGNRGDLAVCGLGDSVAEMFRICRMDRVFTIHRNAEIAVQSMSESL